MASFFLQKCEGDVNECLSNPCSAPGTQACVQLVNSFRCDCRPGYAGRSCDMKVDLCHNNPCQNGGVCSVRSEGYGANRRDVRECSCAAGFHGELCNFTGSPCENNPCFNGGSCLIRGGNFICKCPSGTEGELCENDMRSDCSLRPCLHGGRCELKQGGGYICNCPENRVGKNCEIHDKTGGTWKMYDLEKQRRGCRRHNCQAKAGDFKCDEECNSYACDFDGGDCTLGLRNPWRNCTEPRCWDKFGNGICNQECNSPECLYDGKDCEPKLKPCNPNDENFCKSHYADGKCDEGCNNAECNWDGNDCETSPPVLIPGALSVVVAGTTVQEFLANQASFLRSLGHILRTNVRIKSTSSYGSPMVYPWEPSMNPGSILTNGTDPQVFSHQAQDVLVFLEIDNRKCENGGGDQDFHTSNTSSCFETVEEAATYFAGVAQRHSLNSDFDIIQVDSFPGGMPSQEEGSPSWLVYVMIGFLSVVMVFVLMNVLVNQKRKSRGITWFPDGFLRHAPAAVHHRRSRRKGPDGQEMRNLGGKGYPMDMDLDSANSGTGYSMGYDGIVTDVTSQYSDDSDRPPSKRMRSEAGYTSDNTNFTDYDEIDPRPWTHQHLEAADIRHPDILALTPPEAQKSNFDVDVRGPCGLTPLMVASLKGGGLDAGEEEEDDGTAEVIAGLVAQGAQLDATMDKTGETSLHLAARYARADAAKQLLDTGADANAQDNTGRTPLHAAIASDAMGVFQILLRNRVTNLNARMHDGTTPLILAARLAVEGMVENLINSQADINAADNSGRTALHWAAAVNNTEALQVLLNNMANKDAQDERVSEADLLELICVVSSNKFNYKLILFDVYFSGRNSSLSRCKRRKSLRLQNSFGPQCQP